MSAPGIAIPEIGSEFRWWIGVVESVIDPLNVGRVKVRVFGIHDKDTTNISTYDLPWAYPILPLTNSRGTHNLRPSDWVLGFSLDGVLHQSLMVWGVLPSITQSANTAPLSVST